MPDTIHIGGIKVNKKAAIAVGGISFVVAGVVYYRQKRQAAASASASTDTAAATGSDIDPVTGYAYGSPEDQAALDAMQSGTGLPSYDSSSSVGGQIIGYDGSGAPVYGNGVVSTAPNAGPGAFTSNAAWAQYAEDYLINTTGADASAVGNALGKYISGQPLTADMISVVQQAIAFAGPVPVAGSSGNPPNWITQTTGTTGSGPPAAKTKVIIAPRNETVSRLAVENHWTPATIQAVLSLNHLKLNSALKRGQKLQRPDNS